MKQNSQTLMRNLQCRLGLAIVLIGISFSQVLAQELPNTILRLATELDAACSESRGKASPITRSRNLVQLVASLRSEKIYVVDYTKTPCEDSGSVCGTGGCPLKRNAFSLVHILSF